MSKGRVVLAMSGGVDSSVSAKLLAEQGYEVIGLFMRTGAHEPAHAEEQSCTTTPSKIRGCCSAIDAADAQRVADRLDIPFYALNFSGEFDRIKDYFADEYLAGRTPNPCVVCNTWLKFGKLWEYAETVEADFIATGHYAKIVRNAGVAELHRAIDPTKDQSYFLFGVRREMLQRMMFPIGDMEKSEVRRIAETYDLGVHQKPDSQEICFVPGGNYQAVVQQRRPESIGVGGNVIDPSGAVVGTHGGVSGFTIGQRKGLGIAFGEPRYVLKLEPQTQTVVIGPKELLAQESLIADRVNWLTQSTPTEPVDCEVKIRYLHRATPAKVIPIGDDRVEVRFETPQSAITPGQATVFYVGDRVIGGGWIEN